MSQQYSPPYPAPHGGNYQPGQNQNGVGQEQNYTQMHSHQAHGGGYQPGQQLQFNGTHKTADATVTERRVYSDQIASEQQQRVAIQRQVGYKQGSESPKKESFLGAFGTSGSDGITESTSGPRDQHRRTYQKGYGNFFHSLSKLRWKYPNIYQMPGLTYVSTSRARHRDLMQRVYQGTEDDRYISPWDGHVAKLVVQSAQEVYDGAQNSTWRRTFVRNISPALIKVANFPFSKAPTDLGVWTGSDWTMVCVRWLPACTGLVFLLLWKPGGAGAIRNNGYYDPFLYRYWGYPKAARNHYESPGSTDLVPHLGDSKSLMMQRVLGPRYLCFLNEPYTSKMGGVVVREVDQSTRDMPYIFIAYTAEQWESEGFEDLHQIAERAAREAGVPAYWIGCSCMQDPDQVEDDVYRISDVMRGAHSLVIAVSHSRKHPDRRTPDAMLQLWGERMWTLPEALLGPGDKDIKVYVRGSTEAPRVISKKQLATVVWNDPFISRQLVDHFNGTLKLSSLELVSIALNCLSNRSTIQHLPGDISYALMGLLRQRPQIDRTDSDFQAFARLSLANDSDKLLERLICMLPKDRNAPWLVMDDAWNANLWDIYPRCQISGVGNDNTVIMDGAFGAAIRWKSFAAVKSISRNSWKRLGAKLILHCSPIFLLIGILLISSPFTFGIGLILLLLSLLIILASPLLVRIFYSGKFWGTQAWFFGFEGYLDLATIESQIFGAYMGRLKWSPSGSSISNHRTNEYGECVGVDPTLDPRVRAMVEQAPNSAYGALKVFTLVDTYTMTVTMFLAVRPPVAVLMCGSEGGMQRAIMCSYDWATQTLYRETILRMETPVLERMFRVNRFRFGLQRKMSPVQ